MPEPISSASAIIIVKLLLVAFGVGASAKVANMLFSNENKPLFQALPEEDKKEIKSILERSREGRKILRKHPDLLAPGITENVTQDQLLAIYKKVAVFAETLAAS